ncbi:ubiquinol-cytochrome c reductase iron-sulfur subunit [Rhodocyclus gracilis]|uniref:Ubiquinol-cytochrome c reductase iron-sulfur subunit n=1 Tax=Rhodocyclus tenuis TaxID=1066 RepID=A0A6L5JXL2_RHOTE|nr:ubiquinol-cytochrome c reductase iron-sulfur subunit [Rhodocyclus gracilis]MQY52097.1 ubiquinol-cytochrome c reductase iron-sulfur subunit [Rhodocyclus gracilis]
MSNECKVDDGRRRLIFATAAVGGVGAIGALVPFLSSMLPSERAKAAGAPVEVDVSKLEPGQMMTVEWRGKPVWIINRTEEMLASLGKLTDLLVDPKCDVPQQPEYCHNETRSIKPNYMVVVGICTHLGCSPGQKFKSGTVEGMPPEWLGGFLCPCHGSTFDFAGRVFKNKPAPINLPVPPHTYLADTRILIGEDKKGA